MAAMSKRKLNIMIKAFSIRLSYGESFDEIAEDYTALSPEDIEAIRKELFDNCFEP